LIPVLDNVNLADFDWQHENGTLWFQCNDFGALVRNIG
jgi:hypothetical protein